MKPTKLALGILAALGLSAGLSHAATITLDVAADTYLRANSATTNRNDEGQLLVGSVGATAVRPLLRFDLTALDNLGPITINSVTLTVTNTGTNGSGSAQSVSVYSYAFNFGETTATWNNPAGNGDDTNAGGTIGTLLTTGANHSVFANNSTSFDSTAAFVSAVTNAIGGANTINFILQGDVEASGNNFYRFRDRESFSEGFFQMTVDYTVIPEPSTALLGGLGMLALLRRRR